MEQVLDKKLATVDYRKQLQETVLRLDREQLLWLEGYVAGVLDRTGVNGYQVLEAPVKKTNGQAKTKKLRILFGSHSGNSVKVAKWASEEATRIGIISEVSDMTDYNPRQLKDEEQLLVIISTHGEGEPPLAAEDLYQFLSGKKAPKLNSLPYAVIALGDSAYKKFCQTGIDFYDFLKKQGGDPIQEVIKLDTDFQDQLSPILTELISKFKSADGEIEGLNEVKSISHVPVITDEVVEVPVYERIQLNGKGSEKETWHIEVSTEDTGLQYEPGDALEVYASNSPELVNNILSELHLSGEELVEVKGQKLTIVDALKFHFELTLVTPQVMKKYATFLDNDSINHLLDDIDKLDSYLEGTDVLDLLKEYPVKLTAEQLVSVLRKLPPRLYSIASSQEAVGEEVHITVGAVRYEKNKRKREGVCSIFLADRLKDDENLKVKVRPNQMFRLPQNGDVPVIMIGAGTGIAPYRAFLQHRDALKAKGKNWLIFGDQRFATDFLYQAEWLNYRKKGVLTRMDVAFSRDQKEKIYVQNRLKENSKELYDWLQDGAHIYICGDMKKMAKDVKKTLIEILIKEGKQSSKEAESYMKQLKKEGRFQEDVY